jgi:hypothetical protein
MKTANTIQTNSATANYMQLVSTNGNHVNIIYRTPGYPTARTGNGGFQSLQSLWKLLRKRCFIIIVAMLGGLASYSQDIIRQTGDMAADVAIVHQVDSIKQEFNRQGFVVVKEAAVQMESEYELPIVVPLNQGTLYQFVFIGDITSKLYEVRMYDWNEKQVVYLKKQWGDVDGNVISYAYVPQFSEYHMIKPVQVNKKKKELGGYILLFKKVA